jgi:hypothetical protein
MWRLEIEGYSRVREYIERRKNILTSCNSIKSYKRVRTFVKDLYDPVLGRCVEWRTNGQIDSVSMIL